MHIHEINRHNERLNRKNMPIRELAPSQLDRLRDFEKQMAANRLAAKKHQRLMKKKKDAKAVYIVMGTAVLTIMLFFSAIAMKATHLL